MVREKAVRAACDTSKVVNVVFVGPDMRCGNVRRAFLLTKRRRTDNDLAANLAEVLNAVVEGDNLRGAHKLQTNVRERVRRPP